MTTKKPIDEGYQPLEKGYQPTPPKAPKGHREQGGYQPVSKNGPTPNPPPKKL